MRRRLDDEMVRRGLTANRSEADRVIGSGRVLVSGTPATNSGTLVAPGDPIAVAEAAPRYVSRGGEKLHAALDRFGLSVEGMPALDAGASTGGFTDCLLARGSSRVVALDVAYGQLDWSLRQDPRVTVLERVNVRTLQPELLPYRPDLIVADLSFISLRLVLPALVRCAAPGAHFVLLVKPQFEADRGEARGGVVRDPDVWRRVLSEVAEAGRREGLLIDGVMASPLVGPAGNAEFFLHAVGGHAAWSNPGPLDLEPAIGEAVSLVHPQGPREDQREPAGA